MKEKTDDTVRSRILTHQEEFTKADARIARVILSDYPMVGLNTLADLGEQTSVSAATVLRFVGKLGFPSFPNFQETLRKELQSTLDSPLSRFQASESLDHAEEPLAQYAYYATTLMKEASEMVSTQEFMNVAELLANSRNAIHLIGGRYSHSLAELFSYGLIEMRGNIHIVKNDTRTMVENLLEIGKRDVVVAFDFRRYQPNMLEYSKQAQSTGATIVLFTDKWHSPCVKYASHVLTFPVASPSIYDSGLAPLMCIEALILRLSELLKQSAAKRIEKSEDIYERFQDES